MPAPSNPELNKSTPKRRAFGPVEEKSTKFTTSTKEKIKQGQQRGESGPSVSLRKKEGGGGRATTTTDK